MNWFTPITPTKRKPYKKGVRINAKRIQELLYGRNIAAVARASGLTYATIYSLAHGENDRMLRSNYVKLEHYFKEKLTSDWDYIEKHPENADIRGLIESTIKSHKEVIAIYEWTPYTRT